ncbi:MAG: SDR family NAD(P)-dependent oxidoreductase [Myxococcaceae bacterium]|nr:SDR family NAD(P)-dependent oxidoreductase [Myxococcaceae bacterium]
MLPTVQAPSSVSCRLFAALWRQQARTTPCPDTPRLDGALALVTGGNAGIGLETSLGLARRGAEVILCARREAEGEAAVAQLETQTGRQAFFVRLDLGDLPAVTTAVREVARRLPGRPVTHLVANAGLWPREYRTSPQGHELAFATNVLGHHLLLRGLSDVGALATRARVVIVTGDIYVTVRDASEDFTFTGATGGQTAYCRSKLANAWQAFELARREPTLEVVLVHPGVVASGLGGSAGAAVDWAKRQMLIDTVTGAQTSLWAATQPVTSGAYLHNTLGLVSLPEGDPALQRGKAAACFDRIEALVAPYRPRSER